MILDAKRTAKMSGSRFFRSDRILVGPYGLVQSGFQNLDLNTFYIHFSRFMQQEKLLTVVNCALQRPGLVITMAFGVLPSILVVS